MSTPTRCKHKETRNDYWTHGELSQAKVKGVEVDTEKLILDGMNADIFKMMQYQKYFSTTSSSDKKPERPLVKTNLKQRMSKIEKEKESY